MSFSHHRRHLLSLLAGYGDNLSGTTTGSVVDPTPVGVTNAGANNIASRWALADTIHCAEFDPIDTGGGFITGACSPGATSTTYSYIAVGSDGLA